MSRSHPPPPPPPAPPDLRAQLAGVVAALEATHTTCYLIAEQMATIEELLTTIRAQLAGIGLALHRRPRQEADHAAD